MSVSNYCTEDKKNPTPYVTQSDIVLVHNRSKSWFYNFNSDAWNKALCYFNVMLNSPYISQANARQ